MYLDWLVSISLHEAYYDNENCSIIYDRIATKHNNEDSVYAVQVYILKIMILSKIWSIYITELHCGKPNSWPSTVSRST